MVDELLAFCGSDEMNIWVSLDYGVQLQDYQNFQAKCSFSSGPNEFSKQASSA
jgi:hypothetical protein